MKKRKKPIIFVQEYGTFPDQVLVCAGATKEHVLQYLRKHKGLKEFVQWIKNSEIDFACKEHNGVVYGSDNKDLGRILTLKSIKDDWKYWETLMHEVHHLVYYTSGSRKLSEELEAQAYLLQYLFRSIRRKLQGIDPRA